MRTEMLDGGMLQSWPETHRTEFHIAWLLVETLKSVTSMLGTSEKRSFLQNDDHPP